MKPIPERQDVDTALTVWARAERNQQGVVSDDNGTIELLYSSVRQQAPEVSAALTRHAVQQMVGKIHSEVQRLAAASGNENTESLLAKIPSLGRFAASGKLGNLRAEWQQLMHGREAMLQRIASERKQIFDEFRHLMPSMPLGIDASGTVTYRTSFDSIASQQQLREQLAEIDAYPVKSGELSSQFQKDLPRSFLKVDTEGISQRFGLRHEEQKLAALRKVFDNDEAVLGSVSKVLNQIMPTIVLVPHHNLYPNTSGIVLQADKKNEESSFFQIRRRGEIVELSVDTYGKIDTVGLPGNLENLSSRLWRMNQGERWSGDPGPENYGRHTHFSFTLDIAAARNGELRALEGTQLHGLHEIRLCPVVRDKT